MVYIGFSLLCFECSELLQDTFEIHWGKHHRTYVNNLNNQIQGKDLESKSLEEVDAAPVVPPQPAGTDLPGPESTNRQDASVPHMYHHT